MGITSLMNGQTCFFLLRIIQEGWGKEQWGEKIERVLENALDFQRDDGRFPCGFDPDSEKPTTFVGFAGSEFIAPLLSYNRMFKSDKFYKSAKKALEHYWREFSTLDFPGIDLDTAGDVDSDSCYSLMTSFIEMHRQENDPSLLDKLAHVLHFGFSFQFAHNTKHRNSPCDWSSSGGRVTCTQNVHIHARATLLLEGAIYYLKHRKNEYFELRIKDAFDWAKQAYNRTPKEYGWGKEGCLPEQYYHTYDYYHNPVGDGTTWEAYFPWAAGELIGTLALEIKQAENKG